MTHKKLIMNFGLSEDFFKNGTGVTENVFAFTIFFNNSYIEGRGRWRSKAVLRL